MKYVIFDTETTGLKAGYDDVIQFAYLVVEDGIIIDAGNQYFNTEVPISKGAFSVHGLDKKFLATVAGSTFLQDFILTHPIFTEYEDVTFVAYNASFDIKMITYKLTNRGYKVPNFGDKVTALNHNSGRHNYCIMKGLANSFRWKKWKKLTEVRHLLLSSVTDDTILSVIESVKTNFGVYVHEESGFHDALYDVVVTALLLIKYKDRL